MNNHYDIVIAGGGIAGSAFGLCMQKRGARVLILETTREFRDRVRGEAIHPWGVAEALQLGLGPVLERAAAIDAQYWDNYVAGERVARRDLAQTTLAQLAGRNVHHPELQTALLAAAHQAGVEVRRGTRVAKIEPGAPVALDLTDDAGESARVTSRLAAIADGRRSPLREALGIGTSGVNSPVRVSGVLLRHVACPEAAIAMCTPPAFGEFSLVLPLSGGRARLYLVHPQQESSRNHAGPARLQAFFERCIGAGACAEWFSAAQSIGPLATFDTHCVTLRSSELPAGVVLIGDAAGNVDPAFGCGMSLALRDARCLAEELHETPSAWSLAAARYTKRRRQYHNALLRLESWLLRLLFTTGREVDALRAAAFARMPQLGLDLVGIGPDGPIDDRTEQALFAVG
jgi:2-polyprenyl-6-methoxyphenol hydroxylase-like FAD-dependent oxidoreductase